MHQKKKCGNLLNGTDEMPSPAFTSALLHYRKALINMTSIIMVKLFVTTAR